MTLSGAAGLKIIHVHSMDWLAGRLPLARTVPGLVHSSCCLDASYTHDYSHDCSWQLLDGARHARSWHRWPPFSGPSSL